MYELSGNDYRVATLPKSYLTIIGIIIQSLETKLTNRAKYPKVQIKM